MGAMLKRMLALLVAAGCSGAPPSPPVGPVALGIEQAAERNGVPADLMLAVAAVEGGLRLAQWRVLRLDDDVPVAGALELRHGGFDSLARGAALMGTDEVTLELDTDRGTEAGARVLAELGAQTGARDGDLGTWRNALEQLSGHFDAIARADYADRVFAVLRSGGTFPARDGEQVVIAPHEVNSVNGLGERQQAASGTTPDFAGAIWFTTPMTNKWTAGRPDGNASVNTIVIHDTEGGWDASVATLQNDSGKSVHYIVDADGSRVGQFVHETDTAWHAGNWQYNMHSVGIEHVGFAANATGYSDGLYGKSVKLVKDIRTRWTVPLDRTHIIGHYQIPDGNVIPEASAPCTDTLSNCETGADWGGASNHRDPGFYWQWCQYMESLGGTCTCDDTYPLWNCTTDLTEAVRCSGGKVEIDHCTAGCVSKPVGTDDVCNHTPSTKPKISSPEAEPPRAANGEAGGPPNPNGPTTKPSAVGGCAVAVGARSGGAQAVLALFAVVMLLGGARRIRRS
jgi:N-acetyl-anhydromuramyl-L-alanine amidase AmpD